MKKKKKTKKAIVKAVKVAAKAAAKALHAVRTAGRQGVAWVRLALRVQCQKWADRPGYGEALVYAALALVDLLLDSQRLKVVLHRTAAAFLAFLRGPDLEPDLEHGYWD